MDPTQMLDFFKGEPIRFVIDLPRQARDRARFFGQRGHLNLERDLAQHRRYAILFDDLLA